MATASVPGVTPTNSGRAAPVDLVALIDRLEIGPFQYRLLALCAAIMMLDGFDAQSMGYVAPALSRAWNLTPGVLGPVFSSSLLGMLIGNLAGGPLADYAGRKRVIVGAALFFGVCSLLTLLMRDTAQLEAIRLVTGVGLGAAMPNAIALMTEYSPHRHRAFLVMVMFCGFSLGAAVGGIVAGLLMPGYGWSSVFVVGGAIPLLLAPVLMWPMPESLRFLVLRRPGDPRIPRLAGAVAGTGAAARGPFTVQEERPAGFPVLELFTHGRALATVLLWTIFFANLLNLNFLANWLPTLIHGIGLSVAASAFVSALFQVGGTVSPFLLGWLIDRYGFPRVLSLTYLAGAAAVAMLGLAGHSLAAVMVAVLLAGACIVGGQGGSNAMAATAYPTLLRSTGVGWSLGIGRIGSIVGPVIGGLLLAQHWSIDTLFLIGAIPALVATVAVALMPLRASSTP